MNTYLRILAYIKPYYGKAILHALFAILGVVATGFALSLLDPVLNLLFTGEEAKGDPSQTNFALNFNKEFNEYILQYIEKGSKKSALAFSIIVIVAVNVLGNLFRYLSNVFMAYIRTAVIKDLRSNLFEKIKSLHVSYFDGERKGDIITRMTSDVTEVERSVVKTFQSLIKAPFTILFFLGLMIAFSWQLTLFIFAVLPISALVITLIAKSLRKDAYNTQNMLSWIMSVIEEMVSGIRVIKAFNAEAYIRRIFGNYNHLYSKHLRRQFYKQQLVRPFSEAIGVITIGIILWYGGQLVFDGHLNASGFLVYIFYFQQIMQPAKTISSAFGNINRGIASGGRLFNLMDTPLSIREKPDAKPMKTFQDQIEFRDVAFYYTHENVLADINLTIPKGRIFALVGPSGSGKTTLAEMLPRFYDPTEGQLLIDGINAKDYQIASLRSHIGLVTQDPILFNDTIFNNIAFGMKGVTEAQVIDAAKAAHAHEFIVEADNGYYTEIGDRGVMLSGGQRQRLSIARAILKNPPIMILDEATSALDTTSEKKVQEALHQLMQNRTSLIIAHRLSTIQEADQIVVLDKGSIVQQGTHNELINEDGMYHALYEMQQLEG